jgi:hypothetical protein
MSSRTHSSAQTAEATIRRSTTPARSWSSRASRSPWCSSLGIDADAASIPYLAAWAESSDISVIEQMAGLIDRIARRIEQAIRPDAADTTVAEATGETLAVVA